MTWARRLAGGVADAAGDDDGAVRIRAAEAGGADELAEPRDQPHGRRRAKRGQVVLVHAIAQARVADLVEPHELVEWIRAPIREHETVKRHGEARLAQGLHRCGLAEHPSARRNQDVLAAVRVDRVGDQTVDGCGRRAVETIRQHGVDERAFEQPVQSDRPLESGSVGPDAARASSPLRLSS